MAEVLIETSARHIHVTQETLEILFGKGAELTKKKDLSQPGQFASEQRVTVVGPKKELANVSILGPCRNLNQVELSATDARSIGLDIVIRESGDVAGTPGCTLKGPAGEVTIKEGVIVAKRHIHLTPATADSPLGPDERRALYCNTVRGTFPSPGSLRPILRVFTKIRRGPELPSGIFVKTQR